MTLHLSRSLSLPLDVVTESIAILARKGGGKSYTADVLAEEMHAAEVPFVILDPKGDHWGLRSSADGKRDGIPITILGGEHGDLPLAPEDGRIVADLVIEHPGWYLLDISQFPSRAGEIRFGTEFAERLWRAKAPRSNHWPMHLFVDEADMFVPQNTRGELARSVGAYEVLGKQGRGRGLGVSFISQRSAVINKNVLSQTEVLIVLQTTDPRDRRAVGEWFEGNATPEVTRDALSTLAGLDKGEAQIYSPSLLDKLVRVQVRERKTFDSGRTPRVGERIIVPARLAAVDVKAALERMAATVEKAKQQDPKELQRQVRDLQQQIKRLSIQPDPKVVEVELVREVVPAWVADELKDLANGFNDVDRALTHALEAGVSIARSYGKKIPRLIERLGKIGTATSARPLVQAPVQAYARTRVPPKPQATGSRVERGTPSGNGAPHLSSSQQRLLDALAWFEAIGVPQPKRSPLAAVARTSSKSSGFEKNLSTLRTAGLLDYPVQGRVVLTDDGRAAVEPPDIPPSEAELQDAICAMVSGPQAKLLRVLIKAYPEAITREDLAGAAETSVLSSGFEKNLSTLRSFELVDYPARGLVVALPVLFVEVVA